MTSDEIRSLAMDLIAISVELARQLDAVTAERDTAVARLAEADAGLATIAGALDCQIGSCACPCGSRATITTDTADRIHDAIADWQEEHETC